MKNLTLKLAALALMALAAIVAPTTASAQITFTLNNVSLDSGTFASGTLTGTFETNSALTQVLAYDLVASAAPGSPGFTFAGATYTLSDSTITATSLPSFFQLDASSPSGELRLIFSGPGLTATGATLTTGSYESEPGSAGTRTVVSGSVAAVPEPASWAMAVCAVVGFITVRGLRRKSTV